MTQQLLRLVIFFLSSYGYVLCLRDKMDYQKRLTWIVVYSFYVIFLYVAVLINLLKVASIALLAGGLLLVFYYLVSRYKNKAGSLVQAIRVDYIDLLFMLILFLFGATLFVSNLVHYDNFSHWSLMVKYLLTESSLPTTSTGIISFSAYPIGSSLFVYYVSWIVGYSEGVLLISQFLLILAAVYSLFSVIRDDRKLLVSGLFFLVFALFHYFNLSIRMNNLLVDFLLPLVALAAIAGIYTYREDLKRASFHAAVVLSVLSIIKNSGLFFVLIALVYYLFIAIKATKKYGFASSNLVLVFSTIVFSFVLDIIWIRHVKETFVDVTSKHAVSVSSYQEIFSSKSSSIISEVATNYREALTQLGSLSVQGILLIQVLFLVSIAVIYFGFKRKSHLLTVFIALDSAIIVYYIGILLMFLFSMPTEEALVLAGFERYASSMVIFGLGIYALVMAIEMDKLFYEPSLQARTYKSFKSVKHKKAYQVSTAMLFFIAVGLLLSENNGIIYTNNDYKTTVPYKVKEIAGDQLELNTNRYLIISSDTKEVENEYVRFVGKYYLYSQDVDTLGSLEMTKEAFTSLIKTYDYIIFLEDQTEFKELNKQLSDLDLHSGMYTTAELIKKL
ncbi:hypothetical protein [Carnobacterium sp. TMP28]|uniref:hypothetical protein n=1 Tax=Carnobacterium sp. TMP28 TaxID=3397060 RepID=UPI0039E18FA0